MKQPRQRSPLYRLQAFGFSEWNVWALQEGGLADWCATCRGRGIVIDRICGWREASDEMLAQHGAARCPGPMQGCARCRHRCSVCKGARLTPPEPVLAEDFGDRESLLAARLMFPDLDVRAGKRSDMHAAAM